MFAQMLPSQSNVSWTVNKLGTWIGATEVVSGGSMHLHGLADPMPAVRATTANGAQQLQIEAVDAAVANFGELTAYPSPVHANASTEEHGASFLLWCAC